MRGLHFQRPPFIQSKLVRCVKGRVLDVAVDIRKGASTYGKHVAVELTEDNHRQFFIPKDFAHGFAVLSETAVFQYKCDYFYHPEADGGIFSKITPTLFFDKASCTRQFESEFSLHSLASLFPLKEGSTSHPQGRGRKPPYRAIFAPPVPPLREGPYPIPKP